MQPEEIHITDYWRILFGHVPWAFLIEAVLRTIFVFALLITSMRLLGKRMAAQLTKNEMIAMTSLAAAIGVPIQAPDRGLLPPIIIAMIVVVIGRLVSQWACKNPRFESLSQDKMATLVIDSVLQMDTLRKTTITRERLFAHLRSKGFLQLGEVNRVYFEAGGFFTIVRHDKPKPGLKLIPEWDGEFVREQCRHDDTEVCAVCNHVHDSAVCPNCDGKKWVKAVTTSGNTFETALSKMSYVKA